MTRLPVPQIVKCPVDYDLHAIVEARATAWIGWNIDMGPSLEDLRWRCVRYPVARLLKLRFPDLARPWTRKEWTTWYRDEVRRADFDPDYYKKLEKVWLADPHSVGEVILAEMPNGTVDIGDGWHRAAIAVARGMTRFPAILGTLRELPKDVIEHYTGGGCDVFAVALHREYGFQPVAVRGYYYAPDGSIEFETPHVAAMTPAGDVVDATGVKSPGDVLSTPWYFTHKVFDVRLEPISVREAATTFRSAPSRGEVDHARKLARLIFEDRL